MVTPGDDWIPNQLFWRGFRGYEGETTPLFYRLARDARTTIDVGAYVGLFSLLAAIANPRSQVYAFEPMSTLTDRIHRNCTANYLQNVTCVASAVGDADGVADLFHNAGNDTPSSSSLSYEFMRPLDDIGELVRRTVPVVRLDTFCAQHAISHVDLLKIDIETMEASVIRGMQDVLDRDRPHIVCEVLPPSHSGPMMQGILDPLGYHYYVLTERGPLQRDHIAPDETWSNQLFTRLEPPELCRLGFPPLV